MKASASQVTQATRQERRSCSGKSSQITPRGESSIPVRALYDVPEAMTLLSLSRTQIYELIRSRRLVTVTQGRRRLVPADSISEYVQLLLREAGGDDGRAA
jgi:excisionase family DNA binding protein